MKLKTSIICTGWSNLILILC